MPTKKDRGTERASEIDANHEMNLGWLLIPSIGGCDVCKNNHKQTGFATTLEDNHLMSIGSVTIRSFDPAIWNLGDLPAGLTIYLVCHFYWTTKHLNENKNVDQQNGKPSKLPTMHWQMDWFSSTKLLIGYIASVYRKTNVRYDLFVN